MTASAFLSNSCGQAAPLAPSSPLGTTRPPPHAGSADSVAIAVPGVSEDHGECTGGSRGPATRGPTAPNAPLCRRGRDRPAQAPWQGWAMALPSGRRPAGAWLPVQSRRGRAGQRTESAPGCSKMVLTRVDTHGRAVFRTRVRSRHRDTQATREPRAAPLQPGNRDHLRRSITKWVAVLADNWAIYGASAASKTMPHTQWDP